jgi:hypothetical protein
MTKRGGSDLTNSSHRPITVRRRDDNIPQPVTLAHLNLTALSRQVLQRWDDSHGLRHSAHSESRRRCGTSRSSDWVTKCCGPSRSARLGMTGVVFAQKNWDAEKRARPLATWPFRLKLSAGGSLFRVRTHRRRCRPCGHCFFFFRTSAQG